MTAVNALLWEGAVLAIIGYASFGAVALVLSFDKSSRRLPRAHLIRRSRCDESDTPERHE